MLLIRLSFFVLFLFYLVIKVETSERYELRYKIKKSLSIIKDSIDRFFVQLTNIFLKPLQTYNKIRNKMKKSIRKLVEESISRYETNSGILNKRKLHYLKTLAPEMWMFKEIIKQKLKMETHTVRTKDGYLVTVHRIMKIQWKSSRIAKKTVILFHGLWGSSVDWILLGPKKALPYLLLEAGYDVWLANARGNIYSHNHVSKSDSSSRYWNFTWHEIGMFDISAIIDYLIEKTQGKSEIVCIAYSMGATALLVLLSSAPQYNGILKSAILVAPLVYMSNAKGPIRYLEEVYHDNPLSFNYNGPNVLIPGGIFPNSIKESFCRGSTVSCSNKLLLLANGGKKIACTNVTNNILRSVPAGSSTKTLQHYLQLIRSGKFQMFDYGRANKIMYGKNLPPLYQLIKIKVPMLVIHSKDDWLSNVQDVAKFMPHILAANQTTVYRKDFTHLDFLWADDAPYLVYLPVLNFMY